jgi:tRNA pseudouridine55 synthase
VVAVDPPAEGPDAGAEPMPEDEPLVACVVPNGTAVCLGRLVGDPDADHGVTVALERVLV